MKWSLVCTRGAEIRSGSSILKEISISLEAVRAALINVKMWPCFRHIHKYFIRNMLFFQYFREISQIVNEISQFILLSEYSEYQLFVYFYSFKKNQIMYFTGIPIERYITESRGMTHGRIYSANFRLEKPQKL